MFYSQTILARKGPLGKIWLAAHFEKKLTKAQIFSTDISNAVQSLLDPSAPLALRVSGHLMLGLVRIYSKKVKYLMIDCTDAMWKMQFAFQPGKVDIDAQNTVNVDDNRFYGNVSIDLDYPVLENIAFVSNLLPVSRSKGPEDANYVRDLVSSQHSNVEFHRAGDRSSLSMVSRPSLTAEKKASLGAKFEDDIPIFDQDLKLGDNLLSSFSLPLSNLPFPAMDLPLPDFPDISQSVQERVESEKARTSSVSPTKESSRLQSQPLSQQQQQPAKKRKVMERVELDASVLEQRMKDVSAILRRRPHDPLVPSTLRSHRVELSIDDKVYNCEGYCEELKELAAFASDKLPFPFPLKEFAEAETEVEIARQGPGEVSVENGGNRPSNAAMFHESDKSFMADMGVSLPHEEEFHEVKAKTPSGMIESFHRLSLPDFNLSYEERNKIDSYSEHLFSSLEKAKSAVPFSELTKGCSRKSASRYFLEVLHQKTKGAIQVAQSEAYGEILVSAA